MIEFNSGQFPKVLQTMLLFTVFGPLLSGCISMQTTPDLEPTKIVINVQAEKIARHQFSLAPDQNIVGSLASVRARDSDTLSDLARHYGLGYNNITIANAGLDPWVLHNAPQVLLPLRFILPETPREGIVLNLAGMRLFYYPKSQPNTVLTYPVGIGRQGWNTPLGLTKIAGKKVNPNWTVPESIRREHLEQGDPLPGVVHPGPDNPLGHYAMPLDFHSILIHGTNKPYGIGMQVSHGCIQLYPEDIESLFEKVEVGTPVRIVYQPFLAGWGGDMLYLEAYPPLDGWEKRSKKLQKELHAKLAKLAAEKKSVVDWSQVDNILQRADGIPEPVLTHVESVETAADVIPLRHPDRLISQPMVDELTDDDWTLQFAAMDSEGTAQKLAAMLNHLDPQIPARMVVSNGEYQVVAGPFKNARDTQSNAKRIERIFEMSPVPTPPKKNTDL